MPLHRPDVAFFVSVHIPKTAGTTVGSILDRTLFRRVLFDYPEPADYHWPDPRLARAHDFITDWFAGIHGHFSVRRHLASHGGARFLATVRHPVDRIISQFVHEYNDFTPDAPWHTAIASGELDIVEFASQHGVRDAMSRHLDGLDAREYDLLLVSERMALSFHLLNFVIGNLDIPVHYGNPPRLPVANASSERPTQLKFDDWTRQRIYASVQEDVELYVLANERLDAMTRKYLG